MRVSSGNSQSPRRCRHQSCPHPLAHSTCSEDFYRDAVTRACKDCGDEQRSSGPTFAIIILSVYNVLIYVPKLEVSGGSA